MTCPACGGPGGPTTHEIYRVGIYWVRWSGTQWEVLDGPDGAVVRTEAAKRAAVICAMDHSLPAVLAQKVGHA